MIQLWDVHDVEGWATKGEIYFTATAPSPYSRNEQSTDYYMLDLMGMSDKELDILLTTVRDVKQQRADQRMTNALKGVDNDALARSLMARNA
jgi:hypothetical protein